MTHKRKRMCKDGVTPFGRPPKRPEDRYQTCVSVCLLPAEYRRLKAEAKRAGVSLSVYLMRPWRGG